MTHTYCPVCHAQASALTGVTHHAPHCPNGLGMLKWGMDDVSADDRRIMRQEG